MVTSYSPAQMVQVGFNPTVYTTTSDAGSVNLMVQRSGILANAITVNISTASLTAIGIVQSGWPITMKHWSVHSLSYFTQMV